MVVDVTRRPRERITAACTELSAHREQVPIARLKLHLLGELVKDAETLRQPLLKLGLHGAAGHGLETLLLLLHLVLARSLHLLHERLLLLCAILGIAREAFDLELVFDKLLHGI